MLRYMRSVKQIIIFSMYCILLVVVFTLANQILNMGVDDRSLAMFLQAVSIPMSVLFFLPKFREAFFIWFNKNGPWTKALTIGLAVGFLTNLLVNVLRFFPFLLGQEIVGVGIGQYQVEGNISDLGFIIFIGLMTGFTEEFIFRFMAYIGLFLFVSSILNVVVPGNKKSKHEMTVMRVTEFFEKLRENLFEVPKKGYLFWWMAAVSVLFATLHGPTSLLMFWLYFIPSVINCILFLRYGFIAAWLAHASFNIFSSSNLNFVSYILERT